MRNFRRLLLGLFLRFAGRSSSSVRIANEDSRKEFKKYVQRPLKRLVFILAFCPAVVLGSYDSFKEIRTDLIPWAVAMMATKETLMARLAWAVYMMDTKKS